MRITIVHRHFWPSDLPYSQMLGDFASHLGSKGYSVTIIAPCESRSDKNDRHDWAEKHGVGVESLVLPSGQGASLVKKSLFGGVYLSWLAFKLVFAKADVFWVGTTPPVLAATIVRWVSRLKHIKYVYHCQDVHPEASGEIGKLRNKLTYRLLRNLDRANVEQAGKVVVLSEDMLVALRDRGSETKNIAVINNFARDSLEKSIKNVIVEDMQTPHLRQRWIFAGTMGHFQNLELFLEAYLLLDRDQRPDVTFLGGGALKTKLVKMSELAEDNSIKFLEPVSSTVAQQIFARFDVGIVSLAPGVIKYAYPSKVVNYLSAGLRVFAVVEEDSELADLLVNNNIGDVGDMTKSTLLAESIKHSCERSLDSGQSERSKNIAVDKFNSSRALNAYTQLIHSTVSK